MKRFSSTFWILLLLLSMVAFAPQAQATSYDPTFGSIPGGIDLQRPILNQGAKGDALFGGFYRTTPDNLNFLTYVSIANTTNKWVAAHVRLRSGRFSIEVLDFPILLSPYDVFWFQFSSTPGTTPGSVARVMVQTADAGTVVNSGLNNAGFIDQGNGYYVAELSTNVLTQYTKLATGNPDYVSLSEVTIGEIEVFGLFSLESTSHSMPTGYSNFYQIMQTLYERARAGSTIELPTGTTSVAVSDVGNYLMGQVFQGDFTTGLYTGYTMDALANFRTGAAAYAHRDQNIRGLATDPAGLILYAHPNQYGLLAPNADAAYVDPDWATSFGPTWNDGDSINPVPAAGAADVRVASYSLDEVDEAFIKRTVNSTYFNAGPTGDPSGTFHALTTVVLSFPTKYLHVMFDDPSGLPSSFPYWPVGDHANAQPLRESLDVANLAGTIAMSGSMFDMDENPPPGVSSPFQLPNLQWQVTCMPIGSESLTYLADFCFLTQRSSALDQPGDVMPAGQVMLNNFMLTQSPYIAGDPRNNSDAFYENGRLVAGNGLNILRNLYNLGYTNIIPVVPITFDWDFTDVLDHSRSYTPSWDNPDFPDGFVFGW